MVPLIAPLSNFRSKTASPPLCMGPFHLPVTSAANTKVESKIMGNSTDEPRGIRMESPPEREFNTTQECDNRSVQSSAERHRRLLTNVSRQLLSSDHAF